jgi:hypothetical protein
MKNVLASLFVLILLNFTSLSAERVDDYDGDGKADFAAARVENQGGVIKWQWYILKSGGGFSTAQWGFDPGSQAETGSDIPMAGDFDGDGKTDIAVWRIRSGGDFPHYFFILRSSDQTMQVAQWGRTHDSAFPQDYDGDGKTDIAVIRTVMGKDIWHIQQSRDGYIAIEMPRTGGAVTGDYDGDGKADCALITGFQPSPQLYFYVRKSSTGQIEITQFGRGDVDYAVPADYDGDGKTDLAVWRGKNQAASGLWIWRRSSDGNWASARFGTGTINDDYPAPADYDGDGKTDPAFFRRNLDDGRGYFYVLSSQLQGYYVVQWGRFNDTVPLIGLRAR